MLFHAEVRAEVPIWLGGLLCLRMCKSFKADGDGWDIEVVQIVSRLVRVSE
jgi:hypothetical protein